MRRRMIVFKRKIRKLTAKLNKKALRRALILLLIFSALMFCVSAYKKAVPIARTSAETVARGEVEQIVLEAAGEAIKGIDEELYFHVRDSEGKIVNLSANSREVSELCSAVVDRINGQLASRRYIKIKVPVGSVLGGSVLHGRGPSISVRALPYAAAYAGVSSSFSEAGINQTLYTLTLTVKTEVTLVLDDESISFTTETRIDLSEEIIVGNVPGGFIR